MEFDLRYRDFIFQHTLSPKPDPSADSFREHYHTTFELMYIVRGSASFTLEHTVYKIKPGCLLIAKPGEYHNIVFQTDEPFERYVIHFSPFAILPHILEQLEKVKPVYWIADSPLAAGFEHMDQHVSAVRKDLQINSCIGSLYIFLSYLISSQTPIQPADYINEDIKKIIQYIDEHLTEIRRADDLAAGLHMSKSAVYKAFGAQFDTPLMTYIRTQKCIEARTLISHGMPATEVAKRLGFEHYSSFYREYQKIFHEAPGGRAGKRGSGAP